MTPPDEFLREQALKIERGEDCRDYPLRLRKLADNLAKIMCGIDRLLGDYEASLKPFNEFLAKRNDRKS